MSLHGRNAVITGSTRGIGLAIAHVLASKGCNIAINGTSDESAIAPLLADISAKYGVKAIYVRADMSKGPQIREMVSAVKKGFGGIDILVNNAGVQFTAPVTEFPEEQWDILIAINLSAAFHAIKAAIPVMKENCFGRIVNISSTHGLVGSVNKVAYVAAKHGILGLTKVVALEQAEGGITCNAICPGWVDTPLVQKQVEEKAKVDGTSVEEAKINLLVEKQPNKRFIRPESLAEFVALLCTDHGEAVTGEIFTIDGGWTAQ